MLIKLPFPDSSLNPNNKNGKHWGATHAAKKSAFEYAYFAAIQAMANEVCIPGPLCLELIFIAPDRRKRDLDNLLASAKAQIDGICKALRIDDHDFEQVTLSRSYKGGEGALHVRIYSEALIKLNQGE